MTKKDLYERFTSTSLSEYSQVFAEEVLCEFFESNVCIPKGENRHPYADVLHEWIEGAEMQRFELNEWHDTISAKRFHATKVHIKPPEPIYEYKWRVGRMFGIDTVTEQFLTKQEVDGTPFLKIEETKRVRQ